MKRSLKYILTSGKNPKWLYFLKGYALRLIPAFIARWQGRRLLRELDQRPDKDYILSRADYYCRLSKPTPLGQDALPLSTIWQMPKKPKTYYIDSFEILRHFDTTYRWSFWPGDIVTVPPTPTIVKSRPLSQDNTNSVLLKLDKIRHFIFVNDRTPWQDKMPKAIFRGKITGKESRRQFMERYFGSDICDCGDTDYKHTENPAWLTPFKTINEHLQYRYIMALEGNDVASNLKWVMSSNSIAVMPRPTCETWFMEGTLIPNYHYIEIKPDFSDLEERLAYYDAHPQEAQAIIDHAHEYVKPFRDAHREKLIALAVAQKYFSYAVHPACSIPSPTSLACKNNQPDSMQMSGLNRQSPDGQPTVNPKNTTRTASDEDSNQPEI